MALMPLELNTWPLVWFRALMTGGAHVFSSDIPLDLMRVTQSYMCWLAALLLRRQQPLILTIVYAYRIGGQIFNHVFE